MDSRPARDRRHACVREEKKKDAALPGKNHRDAKYAKGTAVQRQEKEREKERKREREKERKMPP